MVTQLRERIEEKGTILWEERVRGGAHWSGIVRRGVTLRITDLEGGSNVSTLLFSAEDHLERYNMPDTLKAQHTAFLTKGFVCYSDMGRILCSITEDTCGWHDTICGVSNAAMVRARYGETRYQEHRNDRHQNAFDGLLVELAKYGLGKRDFAANINFFSKVTVEEDGSLCFHPAHSQAGDFVDLRFEMNTLVALAVCPHPLDPDPQYRRRDVLITARETGPAPADDPCRNRCPENQRGFENTERLYR